jgi:hypothetical protein
MLTNYTFPSNSQRSEQISSLAVFGGSYKLLSKILQEPASYIPPRHYDSQKAHQESQRQ